jgi:anti-anti-sigma factor
MEGDIAVVTFVDRLLVQEIIIQDAGNELIVLASVHDYRKVLLSFAGVDFVSSSMFGKLITFDKKIQSAGKVLKISDVKREIYEVFQITKLNRLFELYDEESSALAAF